jgi:hypothetical protein
MHKANRSAALLREMAAAGIPVDLSVAELDIQIEQVGGVCDSIFFDLDDGRCGCIIDLLIINRTSRPIPIRDVKLRPPWPNSEFDWLSDPKRRGVTHSFTASPEEARPNCLVTGLSTMFCWTAGS